MRGEMGEIAFEMPQKEKQSYVSTIVHDAHEYSLREVQHSGLHGRGAELERDDGATTYAQGLVCSTAHSKQGSARTMSEAT